METLHKLPQLERPLKNLPDKENFLLGKAISHGSELLCPVSTSSEHALSELPEFRAYKLGKQKCSYNQVELVIKDVSNGGTVLSDLKVSEAIETAVGSEVDERLHDSCLKFNVRLMNNNRMHLYIFIVFAIPYRTVKVDKEVVNYEWMPVTRSKCKKGCRGSVIRGLQRFGRMPKRNGNTTLECDDSWKEPRHLYIAIDEASTHVCPRHQASRFRLLAAAFDDKYQLLGTTISSSIRVLANNDAPLGAATFQLLCNLKGGWGNAGAIATANSTTAENIERDYGFRSPLQDIMQNNPSTIYKAQMIDGGSVDRIMAERVSRYAACPNQEKAGAKLKSFLHGQCHPETDHAQTADHSLNALCERLFELCASRKESVYPLKHVANTLGTRKKRINEIIDVLEIVKVVQQQGKERFIWLGSSQIGGALESLKIPDYVKISLLKSKTGLSGVDNVMKDLSQKFIRIFLVDETRPVSWERAVEIILNRKDDPETYRAKIRRLSEIARIYCALHLIIRRNSSNDNLQSGTVYKWIGLQGVNEHLALAASRHLNEELSKKKSTKSCPFISVTRELQQGSSAAVSISVQLNTEMIISSQVRERLLPGKTTTVLCEKNLLNAVSTPNNTPTFNRDHPPDNLNLSSTIEHNNMQHSTSAFPRHLSYDPRSGQLKRRPELVISRADIAGISEPRIPRSVKRKLADTSFFMAFPSLQRVPSQCVSTENKSLNTNQIQRFPSPMKSSTLLGMKTADAVWNCAYESDQSSTANWDLVCSSMQPDKRPRVYNFFSERSPAACTTSEPESEALQCTKTPRLKVLRAEQERQPIEQATSSTAHGNLVSQNFQQGTNKELSEMSASLDPLCYLQLVLSPQQIALLQHHNPAFIDDFLRYYRELCHIFCPRASQNVIRPKAQHGGFNLENISFKAACKLPTDATNFHLRHPLMASAHWKKD
ncbi:hypothetical protein O6H91_20G007500 [Diphasiastrum complanatum]|uniref:Uncharacterized protein n=1 Tax=Diphasiastrum complanatum TaxID=34168 RepID=A0ACC2AP85_DIPCM|nr:hypothetical protein O6H91_20G007500 [Diphasiastrum complanatum]